MSVNITYGNGPGGWLSATLSSTTAPSTLTLNVAVGTLPAATHNATISISSPAASSSQTLNITLTVTAPAAAIALSRTTVSLAATQGGANPGAQIVTITNGGSGVLNGIAAAVAYTAGQPTGWLTASLSATTTPSTLTINATTGTLAVGSYTASITVTATGASPKQVGVTLSVAAPAVAAFPLSLGKKWRYTLVDTTTVVSGGIGGISRFITQGVLIIHVAESGTLGGRTAWRVHAYELNDRLNTTDRGLNAYTYFLATDAAGLLSYDGGWKRVLSNQTSTVSGGTLFLGGNIRHSPVVSFGASTVTVPAGTYQTTSATHFHRVGFAQFAAEDIREDRREYFAPGVGSVYAFWDYWYEHNVQGNALYSRRTVRMTHVDAGPFPQILREAAGNTSSGTSQAVTLPSLAWATAMLGDAGTILTDAGVGCAAVCIQPNKNGQKRIEDWYRFTLSGAANVRIDLDFPITVAGSQTDLDLYLFTQSGAQIRYLNRSTKQAGNQEFLQLGLAAGTYFIGVQAWETPNGRTDYWLNARTY